MRLRFRFTKQGKVRWTSHRDLARMWERALRRVGLPLAYSGGFSPRPKVSFGLALPTGAESDCEYIDAETAPGTTEADIGLVTLPNRLSEALPDGVDVTAVALVDGRAGSLQQEVTSCAWHLEVGGVSGGELRLLVDAALARPEIVVSRERKGHEVCDDIRPAIRRLVVLDGGRLEAELATQPRGVRPAELLAALASHLDDVRVRRISQWIERDGARREPLPAATNAPHAEVRAS